MPEFDCYVVVDWSASSRPKKGKDSVWYCVLQRTDQGLRMTVCENPPTRSEAVERIGEQLEDSVRRERSTLIGFDFAYGYPSGFAHALGLRQKPAWRAVWNELSKTIKDKPDNSNNRFELAADFNRRISVGQYPFWGCPRKFVGAYLGACRPANPEAELAEYRLTEGCAGGAQPVWKLYAPGAVGSQTLLGIPVVTTLRGRPELAGASCVWPFETGLKTLPSRRKRKWLILHAEVFPSFFPLKLGDLQPKDKAQVVALARHLATADGHGKLAGWFAGPQGLSNEQRDQAEIEEGWILGVVEMDPRSRHG